MSRLDIPGRAAFLWVYDEFLKQAPPHARVVEVGVALGKSISYAAEEAIRLNRWDIEIVAVDPWEGTHRNGEQTALSTPETDFELFHRMMKEHAPEAYARIRIFRQRSLDAAALLGSGSCDLVILDAAHDYDNVKWDIAAWKETLRPRGWMGGDDYEPVEYPGVIRAVSEAWDDRRIETRRECEWGTWLVRNAT